MRHHYSWKHLALGLLFSACTGTDEPDSYQKQDLLPAGSECPDAASWEGSVDWTIRLDITEDATLCALYDEEEDLKENLAHKSKLTLRSGTALFPEDAEASVLVPACLNFENEAGPSSLNVGTVSSTYQKRQGVRYHLSRVKQVLDGPDGPRDLELWLKTYSEEGQAPETVNFDGTTRPPFDEVGLDIQMCEAGYASDGHCRTVPRKFYSCAPQTHRVDTHHVVFEGGEVTLELWLGESGDGTEPGGFTKAEGTFDGTPFIQQDYFKLLYHPEHHHFSRDFGVLFDSPIGGVCGIALYHLDPFDEAPPSEVYTIDCDVNNVEARAILSESWEYNPG